MQSHSWAALPCASLECSRDAVFLGCSLNFIHAYGCPESSAKEPSQTFGEQTNRFVTPLFADLSTFHASLGVSCCSAVCSTHPQISSLLQTVALVPVPSADTSQSTRWQGKSRGQTLIDPQVCPSCAFLLKLPEPKADHTVTHLPHRQEFMFFRNVLVTSEKQQIICYNNTVRHGVYLEVVTFEKASSNFWWVVKGRCGFMAFSPLCLAL